MKYVFDSDSLIDLFKHYYRERFPTLWEKFDALVSEAKLISVREVFNEIGSGEDTLATWAKEQKKILFLESTAEELRFVSQIFQVRHFQAMIRKQERLKGKPVADPFVIARAKVSGGCVVTQEKKTANAAKIPNVCDHFGIRCINLEGFMKEENWTF
ncbi:MAG TPA: DUF4411 family protein [Phycisphaerales bacterium]|nr:DUF4411 family protein [Phycisphaerales bacterium]